jgi:biopolymer transport protein ExbD
MKLEKYNSINVIPFIDVLLVLLAIVLLTTTFITKGEIPVSLAKAETAKSFNDKKEFTINIKHDNTIIYDGIAVNVDDLTEKFKDTNKDSHIFIKSDKKANFEIFVKVLDVLKSNQFNNISIVTKK